MNPAGRPNDRGDLERSTRLGAAGILSHLPGILSARFVLLGSTKAAKWEGGLSWTRMQARHNAHDTCVRHYPLRCVLMAAQDLAEADRARCGVASGTEGNSAGPAAWLVADRSMACQADLRTNTNRSRARFSLADRVIGYPGLA
jgi:hypothetical protein